MKKEIYIGTCISYLLSLYSADNLTLRTALMQKNLSQVRDCLKNDTTSDINYADYCTPLPLMLATQNGDVRYVETLLQAGANVDSVDRSGKTALHEAARMGNIPIIWALLRAGSNIHAIYDQQIVLDMAKDDNIRTILQSRPESRQEIEIFCQSTHPRLGENSPANKIPQLVIERIFHFLRLKTD